MLVVTGGCGMIGSNLVRRLNSLGHRNIIVVDNLADGRKIQNISDLQIDDYFDKSAFISMLSGRKDSDIEAVFHLGACSRTTEKDGRYVMENNYRYSVDLLEVCQSRTIPLLYASSAGVYGNSSNFSELGGQEFPLTVYGFSKKLFDDRVRRLHMSHGIAQVTGLRFFNVYGKGEQHKDGMTSPMLRFFTQLRETGTATVFTEDGIPDARRDFVHVDDVVNVLIWAWQSKTSGLFNVGTGTQLSFEDVARKVRQHLGFGEIVKRPFPQGMIAAYQRDTKACQDHLLAAGYTGGFRSADAGIAEYMARLTSGGQPAR